MIDKIVKRWEETKHLIRMDIQSTEINSYKDLVKILIKHLYDEYDLPFDVNGLHCSNNGCYCGEILFIIPGEEGSDRYWYVKISYGSCSGCDTLENALMQEEDQKIQDLMMLCLHIVQNIKEIE